MSEIKTEIKQNPDGSYTITDAHSTADVVRWLLTQDSKETILYLLGDTPQRTWVGLTDEDKSLFSSWLDHKTDAEVFEAIEAKLKEKNT
jgi:hypothetical protein